MLIFFFLSCYQPTVSNKFAPHDVTSKWARPQRETRKQPQQAEGNTRHQTGGTRSALPGQESKTGQVQGKSPKSTKSTPATRWTRREEALRSGTESEKSCSFTRCGLIADPVQVGGNQSSCTGVCDAQVCVCVCTGVQVSCSREGRGESSSHDRNDEELNHFASLAEDKH